MSYTPPPPGSTEVGKPTPKDVAKQDVHIRDLPPEVRRSFLLSMVFFPSAVGAGICAVLFLGWWALREPKNAGQYAMELREGVRAGNKRSRWQTARELAENLSNPKVHDPEVLAALLEIAQNPALDEEVEMWSPSDMVRKADERKTRLRWWAIYLAGHMAGKLQDARALPVLLKALDEETPADPVSAAGTRYYAAVALGLLKDAAAFEPLARRLASDADPVVRAACAKSLGTLGSHHYFSNEAPAVQPDERLNACREALRTAYKKDADQDVTWNAAIALARIKDDTGRPALEKLLENSDPIIQDHARRALKLLDQR